MESRNKNVANTKSIPHIPLPFEPCLWVENCRERCWKTCGMSPIRVCDPSCLR